MADDGAAVILAGATLVLDAAGALWWPAERMLIVADLHLEKGSAFAARGVPLPPYDSRATLAVLARIVERRRPRSLVALGDSFHDRAGADRLGTEEREALAALMRGREMVWIAGNHDPDPVPGLGGSCAEELRVGPLTLRHEPAGEAGEGEIAGHFHPVARVVVRGRSLRRRCFATDGRRLVMPALGAYAGGLNIRDAALAGLFGGDYDAHLVGAGRTYRIAHRACLPDR
ncbi:ligase-associated DNA damage response endonuclease PdeM [Ancylobacter sp. TS-1]|uniref:ligase-associated DNA damage response endonuclease PdeM n=1 Tax=Ancylobacter sp. TS-1 TaxID=1850374 RepID=UPI001265BAD2|nr:ligase-associated DNA damage response endonuclease PdeM [Ancylobacter sp. TS-1]QFR34368.1 ligase-associated DNA damage response endonuclease PdeM [Ancylobacter sp. TS-1]